MVGIVLCPFLVNFGLPGGVGVQNPFIALLLNPSILLFFLHLLYLLIFIWGIAGARNESFFLGFKDFDTTKG